MLARYVLIMMLLGASSRARADSSGLVPALPPSLPPISKSTPEQSAEVGDSLDTPESAGELAVINEAPNAPLPLEGSDNNPEPDKVPTATESLLDGLAYSDAVVSILEDPTDSLTLLSSNAIVDFETQATLAVESYRSELGSIAQQTLQQRRVRRQRAAAANNGNQQARFQISREASHEVRFSPAVVSELSRAAGDVTAEVERRQEQNHQRRRVRKKAILLAPLIFVDRPNRYTLPSLSSAAFISRFETPAARFFLEQPPSNAQRHSMPQQPPRRRKRSHRGFETFSQLDSADRDPARSSASKKT
jgi:hypothetical protein